MLLKMPQLITAKKWSCIYSSFDDPQIIEGQATLAMEILEQTNEKIDYVFVPIGGGGLLAGIVTVFSVLSPDTKIIGVEPKVLLL